MLEIEPTGDHALTLPPVLVISAGRGNTGTQQEVHFCVRRGDYIDPLGWYPLKDILLAVHAAGVHPDEEEAS